MVSAIRLSSQAKVPAGLSRIQRIADPAVGFGSLGPTIGIGTDGKFWALPRGKKRMERWQGFLWHLKDRGLKGVRLIISDGCRGLEGS